VLRARAPDRPLTIEIGPDSVAVRHAGAATVFETAKGVPPSVWPVT